MQSKFKRLAVILALAMSGPATVSAATLYYDNISSLNYSGDSSQTISAGKYAANQFSTADLRTAPSGGGAAATCGTLGCLMGEITLVLRTNPAASLPASSIFDNFYLTVHYDNGNTMGSSLTPSSSRPIANPNSTVDGNYNTYVFQPLVDIVLHDSTKYWLSLTSNWTAGGVSKILWRDGTLAGGLEEYNAFGFPINVSGSALAMSFQATPNISAVPIPGAMWLMGSALIGFAGWGRRTAV
ncbi:MAG: hypothetical protein H6964_14045 [Chromatiaceae bacterium]|nr:hypothetical protein [Chromatiaceae bacterium]